MTLKNEEKERAIKLRKNGFSYSEILKEVFVSKSTLSLWLRSVGLAKEQKQRITEKRIVAALKGAKAKKEKRIAITKKIKDAAKNDIEKIDSRNLWFIGIALYWAEGGKEKDYKPGSGVNFNNSDPQMLLIFIKWLKTFFSINASDLIYDLYIHETADLKKSQVYWSETLSIPTEKIRTYLKKNKINTRRRNTGDGYHGLVRIKVAKSSSINRKITGWIEGVCERLLASK
jgi:hypothetical protein